MQSDDTCTMGKRNEHNQRNTTEHDIRRSNNNDQEAGGIEMKEGLMWFIIVAILGTIIPSKGWLAVFGIVICALGFLMGAIERNSKGKK